MHVTRVVTDESAVSPVIGVIMMVAVTAILASVVGTFALGLGTTQDVVPQATWKVDFADGTSDELTITHKGGDTVAADDLSVVVRGATSAGSPNGKRGVDTLGVTGDVDVETEIIVDDTPYGNDLDLSAATVRLVWEDDDTHPEKADSATLRTWKGPDA